MTRIAPRPGNDAYIVCVGLPTEIVAQVVHALGGQHAVLVAPDSASAVNLLAPDRGADAGSDQPSYPEQPPLGSLDGGRVLAFPRRGHQWGDEGTDSPEDSPGPPLTWAPQAVGETTTGQLPAVTGAIPAVTGAIPVVVPVQRAPIEHGPLTLDISAREVRVQGQEVHLSAQEFDLLATLASQPGRVWTFAELTAHVWGTRYLGDADAVTSAIKRLRRRLPRVRGLEVASVRGVGYRLRVPEQ